MHPDALCREERFDSMLSTFFIGQKQGGYFFTYERRGRSSEAHLIGSHDNMFLLAVQARQAKHRILPKSGLGWKIVWNRSRRRK